MKKVILAILVLNMISIKVSANKANGYFITNDNETINCTFEIPFNVFSNEPDFYKLQYFVEFYDNDKKTKITLYPSDASYFEFIYKNETFQFYRQHSPKETYSIIKDENEDTRLFLHLKKDGPIRLFEHYYIAYFSPGVFVTRSIRVQYGNSETEKMDLYLQKKGESLFSVKALENDFTLYRYFSDCPLLIKWLKTTYTGSNRIELILDKYCELCECEISEEY